MQLCYMVTVPAPKRVIATFLQCCLDKNAAAKTMLRPTAGRRVLRLQMMLIAACLFRFCFMYYQRENVHALLPYSPLVAIFVVLQLNEYNLLVFILIYLFLLLSIIYFDTADTDKLGWRLLEHSFVGAGQHFERRLSDYANGQVDMKKQSRKIRLMGRATTRMLHPRNPLFRLMETWFPKYFAYKFLLAFALSSKTKNMYFPGLTVKDKFQRILTLNLFEWISATTLQLVSFSGIIFQLVLPIMIMSTQYHDKSWWLYLPWSIVEVWFFALSIYILVETLFCVFSIIYYAIPLITKEARQLNNQLRAQSRTIHFGQRVTPSDDKALKRSIMNFSVRHTYLAFYVLHLDNDCFSHLCLLALATNTPISIVFVCMLWFIRFNLFIVVMVTLSFVWQHFCFGLLMMQMVSMTKQLHGVSTYLPRLQWRLRRNDNIVIKWKINRLFERLYGDDGIRSRNRIAFSIGSMAVITNNTIFFFIRTYFAYLIMTAPLIDVHTTFSRE